MPPPIRILALGSPWGDDRVAWEAAELLRCELPGVVRCVSSPWEIANPLAEPGPLLLMDACFSGAPPGTIHRLRLDDLPASRHRSATSHGTTLAEVVLWSRTLGMLAAEVTLLAAEISVDHDPPNLSELGARTARTLADSALAFLREP